MPNFINPYTFFPIEQREPERQDVKDLHGEETLSGYLTCEFDIKSPLFIPNTTKKFRYLGEDGEAKEHFFSEFYSYEDLSFSDHTIPVKGPLEPRIPGSELRGMVRTLYEQLTNSCLSQIDAKNLPHKRSVRVKKAGLLDLVSGKLYQAERLMLNTRGLTASKMGKNVKSLALKTGDIVFINKSKKTYKSERYDHKSEKTKEFDTRTYVVEDLKQGDDEELKTGNKFKNLTESELEKSGYEKGYVLIGNAFKRKHHDSVLIRPIHQKNVPSPIILTEFELQRFEDVLEKYHQNQDEGQDLHDYYKAYQVKKTEAKESREKEGPIHRPVFMPVFYSVVRDKVGERRFVYLSASMYTPEIFSETVDSLLEKDFKHNKCCGKDGCFCPACRLFGMVGSEEALASRLRFSDSSVIKKSQGRDCVYDEPRLLPVLGTPKISSVEFYLKEPEAYDGKKCISWNYDYNIYSKRDGEKIQNEDIVLNDEERAAKLKGRKVYWYGRDGFSGQEKASLIKNSYDRAHNKADLVKDKRLKMTQAVRAIKSGNSSFKIFFEDISEAELKALIFCLNLGDFEGSNQELCHRIGRGKPYGMGAIKMKIKDITFVNYQLGEDGVVDSGYKSEYEGKDLNERKQLYGLGEMDYTTAQNRILTYSNKLSEGEAKIVSYPQLEYINDIYQWFSYNRGEGRLGNDRIIQTLPDLDDEKNNKYLEKKRNKLLEEKLKKKLRS